METQNSGKRKRQKFYTNTFLIFIISVLLTTESRALVNTYKLTTYSGISLADTTGSTQLIGTNINNVAGGVSAITSIGFTFVLNGINYTHFSVNENGLLRLATSAAGPAVSVGSTSANILNANADFPKITAYFDDLKTVTGTVKYRVIGSAPNRKLVVQWNVTIVGPNSTNSIFQLWLSETSYNIQFVYGQNMVTNSAMYSVGLAASTTDYLAINASTNTASSSVLADNNTVSLAVGKSFQLALPPGCATGISPAAAAVNLPLQTTLSWSAGTGTTTGYDVYFGSTSNPPLVSYNQSATTYSTAILNFNSTYYWKVVPRNDSAAATGCTVNQFTTCGPLSYEITRTTNTIFNSIATTGSTVSSWKNGMNTDDNLSNSVPIGFNFQYNGNVYSNFLVSTNGFITFNTSTSSIGNAGAYSYANLNLGSGTAPTSPLLIAPFYEDMVCQGNPGSLAGLNASIRYSTSGTAGSRILTVEWIGMENWQTAGPNLNFQVKLYEGSNEIDFVYGYMEGFNGTFSLNYSYNVGLNGIGISSTPQAGEVLNQLVANTRSFGLSSVIQHNTIADCNTTIHFTPGTYTPYVPPVSLAPSNDSLGAKILLPVYPSPCVEYCGSYFSSAHATKSLPAAACANADDDVWFEFVATSASTQIKVGGTGNYDAVVELMNTSYVQLACGNSAGSGLSETITMTTLVPGTHYYVRVYEKNSGSGFNNGGQFYICVSGTPVAPVNDECANAININVTGLPAVFQAGVSTAAGTASAGIPACSLGGTIADDDVWYKFTALNTKEIIAVNSNIGFNAVIQAFSGTCASLSAIGCANSYGNGQPESLTLSNLTRNAVYYFRVYHGTVGGGTGNYSLSVSSPPPACTGTLLPPNGEIEQPTTITFYWDPVVGADNYKLLLDTVNPPIQQRTITTDTQFTASGLLTGKKYYWTIQSGNATGFTNNCYVFNLTTQLRPYALVTRVFLQSLYVGGRTMKPYLNPADTIADTITVDLVDEDTSINYSEQVLLSIHGYAIVYLPAGALDLNYYLTIRHRNHLETWGNVFLLDSVDTVYDFTSSPTSAVGNNLVQVDTGVYAIYYGDLNQDNKINGADVTVMKNQISNFPSGYQLGDLNGDYIVESTDYSMIENQARKSIVTHNPFAP